MCLHLHNESVFHLYLPDWCYVFFFFQFCLTGEKHFIIALFHITCGYYGWYMFIDISVSLVIYLFMSFEFFFPFLINSRIFLIYCINLFHVLEIFSHRVPGWWNQWALECVALDLRVVSLSPILGVEIT